jgi:hypothetical protein
LWWDFFWDRVLQTICPDWLWTSILLISASWVARITGVSHRRLAASPSNFLIEVHKNWFIVSWWHNLYKTSELVASVFQSLQL